jgi:hypothetical protein
MKKILTGTVELDGYVQYGHTHKISDGAEAFTDLSTQRKIREHSVKLLRYLANKMEAEVGTSEISKEG